MRLQYAVLAIDDQPDAAATFAKAVRDHVEAEGFDLDWKTCESQASLDEHLKNLGRRPDIVIVDNRLGAVFGGQNGSHWAREIRKMFRFTDIVFYGQEPVTDLRTNIATASVDGVYCSNRQYLVDDLRELISVQIRRWTDGPAMRGLAVGIASELDELLRETCIDASRPQEKKVREAVYEEVSKSVQKRSDERPKRIKQHIDADDFEQLFREHTEFTAAELAKAIRWLADSIAGGSVEEAKQFLTRYLRDVVEPRNVLAHGRFDEASGVFTLNKSTFPTTEKKCREFRVALRNYRNELREIREGAKSGKLTFRKP